MVMSRGVLEVFFFLLSALAPSESATCIAAGLQCATDAACVTLLATYSSSCALAIAGGDCSAACKDAYAKLIANANGQQYAGCDCGGVSQCLIPPCLGNNPPDDTTTKPATVIKPTCFAFAVECNADTTCAKTLIAEVAACSSEIAVGRNCSQECKDAYSALAGNAIGKQFYDCTCTSLDRSCTSRKNLADNCYGGTLPAPSSGSGNVASMLVVLTCAIVGSLVLTAQ